MCPLSNEDIKELLNYLKQIEENTRPISASESTYAVIPPIIVKDESNNKGGRPKGSKNVKRTVKRKRRANKQVLEKLLDVRET